MCKPCAKVFIIMHWNFFLFIYLVFSIKVLLKLLNEKSSYIFPAEFCVFYIQAQLSWKEKHVFIEVTFCQ